MVLQRLYYCQNKVKRGGIYMRKVTYKYKIIDIFQILLCGIIFGVITFRAAQTYIIEHVQDINKNDWLRYMINVMFFNDGYKTIDYMQGNVMKLLTITSYFYLPPVILLIYKYSKENFLYYSMVMVRMDSKRNFIKKIRKNIFLLFGIYSCGFTGSTFVTCFINVGEVFIEKRELIYIALLICSRTVVLAMFGNIFFLIHIKSGAGKAFFWGSIIFYMILILDINIDGINLLLYHPQNYFFDSIILSCVVTVAVIYAQLKCNIKNK